MDKVPAWETYKERHIVSEGGGERERERETLTWRRRWKYNLREQTITEMQQRHTGGRHRERARQTER